MNFPHFAQLFLLGSHLCREPMPPMSELKQDMENLKRHGFNLIKLQENWAVDEPCEGQVDFSRYEELVDYAARLDLGVYLGLTCEQAPGWLWRKHPTARMVGRNGLPIVYEAQTTLPADGKPGPCYDHPGAMADQLRFIRHLVQTLGRYENIVCWNTWQEIGYWGERFAGQHVCYCDNTLNAFRAWLEEGYDNLDSLNRAWNTRYLDWEAIAPDRLPNIRYPQPQNIDWHYFMDNVQVARVLQARAQIIKQADPFARPVFAHKAAPAIGSGQDWTYARCQDFLGSSCYPAWGPLHPWDDGYRMPLPRHEALLGEMWNGVALRYDYIRCANCQNAPIWAAEFQGGPVSTGFHKGRVPSPEDIRRWMLTALASGVTALSFWVTRAEIHMGEPNGFSLLDSAGDSTPRYEEAARIGQALGEHADLFALPNAPQAQVAILINEMNYQLTQLMSDGYQHLPYSVRGWYRLLWDANIPVDFIEVSELDEARVQAYKALILAFPLSLSDQVAQQLVRYVEQGGNLISEAAPGRVNEHGYCTRGELSPPLAELFGVSHQSFTMVREPGDKPRWSPEERTWGEYLDAAMLEGVGPLLGQRVRAHVYIETWALRGGQALLRYGDAVAGSMHQKGQGRAWMLGTYVGHSGTAYQDTETQAAVHTLLTECGIQPEAVGSLLLRKRVAGNREAWFLTNPTQEDVTEWIHIQDGTKVNDLLGTPLEHQPERVKLCVKSLDVAVLLIER